MPKVKLHNMITVRLGNNGEITHIVNDKGGVAQQSPRTGSPFPFDSNVLIVRPGR